MIKLVELLKICNKRCFVKEFGKILKFFRESKNLSLREVAGCNLSSSQISRFERGETSLSINNFYYCLKNMNVTFREFEIHLKNFIQDDNTVFDKSISEAYLEGNISKLESLLKTLDTQSGKIAKLNSIVIKIAIFLCDPSKPVPPSDIQLVSDYLFSIDEWSDYEVWLFGNTVFILSPATLVLLGTEMLSKTYYYKSDEANKRKVLFTCLNIISCLLDNNELSYSLKFLNYLDNIVILETDTYVKIFYKYVKLLYAVKMGDTSSKLELEKLVNVLEFLDCYGTAKKIKLEISRL